MLSVVAIVYQQQVVLIVLCGVALVAIVVEQDTNNRIPANNIGHIPVAPSPQTTIAVSPRQHLR